MLQIKTVLTFDLWEVVRNMALRHKQLKVFLLGIPHFCVLHTQVCVCVSDVLLSLKQELTISAVIHWAVSEEFHFS